jgi:undecaprenyl-diphosphatase
MLEFIKAFILGIIEGITEWLPVSSTGHLILFNSIWPLNMSDSFKSMFDVVIQLGAIMAVVVIYFTTLWPFCRKKEGASNFFVAHTDEKKINLWLKIIVSVLPAIVVGLPLDDWLDEHLYNAVVVSVMLIVYGVLFILVENANKHRQFRVNSIADIRFTDALLIGIFQCLAMIPGTSRSGATIIGGILIGLSRSVAAEYTFFLAIPTMFGASLLKIVKFGFDFTMTEVAVLMVGCIVAFVVSVITIKFFMSFIRKHDFKVFGFYRIILGAIVLALAAFGMLEV